MPTSPAVPKKKVSLTFGRPWLRIAISSAEIGLVPAFVLIAALAGGATVPIWVFPVTALGVLAVALGVCSVYTEPEQFAAARAMKRYREEHGIPRGGTPADATR